MAKTFFAGRPLGKRFSFAKDKDHNPEWLEIVGVAADARENRTRRPPEPFFYIPMSQGDVSEHTLLVRTSANPDALLPAIRRIVHSLDSGGMVSGAETMSDVLSDEIAEPRFQTRLLGAFGALALLLAVVGIYGVTSYSLAQRTREMGIRVALGAGRRDILRLVLGQGMTVAVAGIAAGSALAFALTRYLGSLLFEIKPNDPLTFIAVAVALVAAALLAAYLPARRASRLDPVTAMRHE
jgi:putative ABC transport system permease protein